MISKTNDQIQTRSEVIHTWCASSSCIFTLFTGSQRQNKMSVTVYIQNLKSSAGIAGDVGELLGQIDELHSKKLARSVS